MIGRRQQKKIQLTAIDKVKVIVDSRNSYKDIFILRHRATSAYKQGLLAWDVTNQTYTTPEPGVIPRWLREAKIKF